MSRKEIKIDLLFETSWEVCNKIGGIYTVLSSESNELLSSICSDTIFIGPDFDGENKYFKESKSLMKDWREAAVAQGLNVRVGKWNIPSAPIVILVNFKNFLHKKNDFFFELWQNFGVNSLHSYGDYDESVVFGLASAKVVESYCSFFASKLKGKNIIAEFHEWTTASGLLYVKAHVPAVKTVFKTHATTVGRSICFNNKRLYEYFEKYNGDQMAGELNVEAKHSIEKMCAHNADCFTTVSDLTGAECGQLLDKVPDVITPNGIDETIVPQGETYEKKRKEARTALLRVAENLIGKPISKDAIFVATSGRYEYRNKGIDVFIESLKILSEDQDLGRDVVAFLMVPANISGPRRDLQEKISKKAKYQLTNNNFTHDLYDFYNDSVISALRYYKLDNNGDNRVKIVFVPSYLDGNDGIFNKSYYDLLVGMDITVFASYYEPWGYTPHESAAFGIPTITTSLTGFGNWISRQSLGIENGVAVLERNDNNFHQLAAEIEANIISFSMMSEKKMAEVGMKARKIAERASWKNFSKYLFESYKFALSRK